MLIAPLSSGLARVPLVRVRETSELSAYITTSLLNYCVEKNKREKETCEFYAVAALNFHVLAGSRIVSILTRHSRKHSFSFLCSSDAPDVGM